MFCCSTLSPHRLLQDLGTLWCVIDKHFDDALLRSNIFLESQSTVVVITETCTEFWWYHQRHLWISCSWRSYSYYLFWYCFTLIFSYYSMASRPPHINSTRIDIFLCMVNVILQNILFKLCTTVFTNFITVYFVDNMIIIKHLRSVAVENEDEVSV